MTEIEAILQKYQNRDREYLLPILQDIQSVSGFLSRQAVISVAAHLKIPTSKVYAVATFYERFRFLPKAKYRISVCNGTGCHIEGSGNLLEAFKRLMGLEPGAELKNELFSLEVVQCLGACGNAPVIKINDVFYSNVTPDMVPELIAAIKAREEIK
ncbi:MAG: NAD(P)H-dependent oxidoreductase subunit E [Bacteroidales bacterium]|nr:NAD(P)H-dependent oxidoreductase subunit E [Bacteroidales bacterium]